MDSSSRHISTLSFPYMLAIGSGHEEVIVKLPRYFGLQSIRFTGRANITHDEIVECRPMWTAIWTILGHLFQEDARHYATEVADMPQVYPLLATDGWEQTLTDKMLEGMFLPEDGQSCC